MERKKVDVRLLIEKGDYLVISLAGFDDLDTKSFGSLFRTVLRIRKDSVYVPMFERERSLCYSNVWEAFSKLVQKRMFAEMGEIDYSNLLARLGKNRNTVYVIAKDSKIREEIIRSNTNNVRVVFCDLDSDGQLYCSKVAVSKKANYVVRQRDYEIATIPSIHGLRKLAPEIAVSEGSVLCNSTGVQYMLVKKELRNNGAYTYSTNRPGVWAKIYDDDYNSSSFFEDKVYRMLKNPVNVPGIIWPKDILRDTNGVFRGFLIEEYAGNPLQTSIFKRDGLKEYFKNWTKYDVCTLTLTILYKIKELHKRGILFGCINPATIRVVDPHTVFFCDTDDYQIEGYPSLSSNISFAAPENIEKKFYLATLDSENFSVAELVFMLLMTGKTPYLLGNSNIIDTIKRMRFPFFVNDYDERNPSGKVLPSMWRFMWSHLSLELKKAFCGTFQKNMPHNGIGRRFPASKWYQLVEQYRNDIQCSPSLEDKALYPTTFKKKEGDNFYTCPVCKKEHPKFFFDPQYFAEYQVCNVCIEKKSDTSYTCVNCNRTFVYNIRTALYHLKMKETNDNWKKQRHCPECKSKKEKCSNCSKIVPYYELNDGLCRDCQRSTVFGKRTCSVCHKEFSITYEEKKNWDSWAMSNPKVNRNKDYYPKKCNICRGKRR